MPLQEGHSQEVITTNIKELVRSGKKPKQAIAIAIAEAHKHKKMTGEGVVAEYIAPTETPDASEALGEALGGETPAENLPNQALSDGAKQAILESKKKRNFTQG